MEVKETILFCLSYGVDCICYPAGDGLRSEVDVVMFRDRVPPEGHPYSHIRMLGFDRRDSRRAEILLVPVDLEIAVCGSRGRRDRIVDGEGEEEVEIDFRVDRDILEFHVLVFGTDVLLEEILRQCFGRREIPEEGVEWK